MRIASAGNAGSCRRTIRVDSNVTSIRGVVVTSSKAVFMSQGFPTMAAVGPGAAAAAPPGNAPANNGARLHVFIIGVSEYSNLPGPTDPMPPTAYGMRKLSSPAISAFKLYEWITTNQGVPNAHLPLPLGHCSLLLSPSHAEATALAAVCAPGVYQSCTIDNVMAAANAWRKAASTNPEDITWFYFAGHGVETSKNDAVLLLEGFGDGNAGALFHAFDLNTLFNGMAPTPSRPNIARTQVYFVDACRVTPDEFRRLEPLRPSQIFNVELGGKDDRAAPIFFASVSGDYAAGFKGRPSIFNELLRQCLDGMACAPAQSGNGSWSVTSNRFIDAMHILLEDYHSLWGIDQTFTVGGLLRRNIVLRPYQGRPNVDVTISVDPDAALPFVRMDVLDVQTMQLMQIPTPLVVNGHTAKWPAGFYRVEPSVGPHATYRTPQPFVEQILPPRCDLVARV
jgi:hypothetical protein